MQDNCVAVSLLLLPAEGRLYNILTTDKITEIFCITDDFCKEFSKEMEKVPQLPEPGKRHRHRNRPCEMSNSEIITILMLYHFGSRFA
jgi:hypothetical protein